MTLAYVSLYFYIGLLVNQHILFAYYVRMCFLLMHSCHSAQMLIVSVARQRILIYPAWLSHPLRVQVRNQSSKRPSHSML